MQTIAIKTERVEVHPVRTVHHHFINYSYIVVDRATRDALIIDPAWEWDTIHSTIVSLEVNLRSILLTHSHVDHVNLVSPLLHTFQTQVYMSQVESEYYGFRCDNLNALQDGDSVQIGMTEMKAILTPGHTAGSMCYYTKGAVFTGDTIFSEGCGQCTSAGSSAEQMYDSIQRIRLLPLNTCVYPAHSFGSAPGQALDQVIMQNIYFHILNKQQFVNFRTRKLDSAALLAFK